jgi:hypothetical protein
MKCAMTDATWKRVHGELIRLARSKGAYDAEEARWLLEGKRVRVHEPLGYGSFLSYVEYVLGYGPPYGQRAHSSPRRWPSCRPWPPHWLSASCAGRRCAS